MIGPTVLVAIVAIVLAARARPVRALGILIASMYLYPEYLRIPIGLAQMSVPRVLAAFLLCRFLASRQQFRWRFIDTVVSAGWVWSVAAAVLARAQFPTITEAIGRVFDTVLVYFVARLAVTDRDELGELLAPLAISACAMGLVGVIEATTSHSPYQVFTPYEVTVGLFNKAPEYRFGFLRAQGSLAHSIYFGMAMFLLLGVLIAIRGYCRSRVMWTTACAAATCALISSLSSGPQEALLLLLITNAFYFCRRLIKPALACIVVLGCLVETASNRHFWYLTEYLNPFGGDYWYRSRLIEVATAQWREYWLVGVGSNWPNHWGALIDGRLHVDIVNHYIIMAVLAGLPGLVLFIAGEVLAVRDLTRAWPQVDERGQKLVFGLGATLVALIVSSFSIGLYSVPLLMTYALLGMIVGYRSSTRGRKRRKWAVRYRATVESRDDQLSDQDAPNPAAFSRRSTGHTQCAGVQ